MKVRLLSLLVGLFAMGMTTTAFAHHGFNVEFDASKCMDLKGTLTAIYWENPHAYFDMEAKNADGEMETWHLEMVTPNALKRTGTTKQDFLAHMGKTINARACRSKVGDTRGAASYIALSDGLIRLVGQQVERRPDADKRF
jgi:hypothetical protein